MSRLALKYRNARVFVTGGAGFIGSQLVHKLVQYGAQVTILDHFSTGVWHNIAALADRIKVIRDDFCHIGQYRDLLMQQHYVFHMAAISSIKQANQNVVKCFQVNVHATEQMVSILAQSRILKKLIFSSTAAVYGERREACVETDKISPVSAYAQSKAQAETIIERYAKNEQLKAVCLRYFNVVGEQGGQAESAVSRFKKLLLAREPITIFGNGQQCRDFVSIDEVVMANLLIAAYASGEFEVFNIGSGKAVSLLELVGSLAQELEVKNYKLDFQPPRLGDVNFSLANVEKWKNFLQEQRKNITNDAL